MQRMPASFAPFVMSAVAALLAVIGAGRLRAQGNLPPGPPRILSYQGVLVEPDGVAVDDGSYTVTLRIYGEPIGGTPLWEETQTVTTLDGVFDALLGLSVPLESLMFDRQYWLAVELQGEAEMTPRMRMVAAPYAIYAARAAIADSLAGGVVRSLNRLQGHLTLRGGSGTTITESGDTITISMTGGTVQENEPTLSQGSIWYGDINDQPVEREIGRVNDVLVVGPSGTEPEWSSNLTLNSVATDTLNVNEYTRIEGPARFGRLPDFPLNPNAMLVGGDDGRVRELPAVNTPGAVLQLDSEGKPQWQRLPENPPAMLGDRVPTEGKLLQIVAQPAVTAASTIIVSYQDPEGGASIPVKVLSQTAGSGFTVQFTALPPQNTFLVYMILP